MSMSKYCRALFLLLALSLPISMSCSDAVVQTVPLLRLRLNPLPEGTNKVTVTITVGDTTRTIDFVSNGSDTLDTLTVSFPEGTTGPVTISISARDAMDCLIGSGSGNLTLTNNDVRELPIGMTRPPLACGTPAAKIIVQINNTGTAMGTVTAVNPPGGISCGQDCEEVYAVGSTVTLHAEAATGSFFGWSGACSDTNDCTIPLGAEGEYIVKAAFGDRPCKGWCEEPSSTTRDLYGIYGTGALNIVAVGANGTVVKWDGQSWNSQTSGVTESLRAVNVHIGGTNFLAVGDGGTILNQPSGMTTWTKIAAPGNMNNRLNGIAGARADEVYIGGDGGAYYRGGAAGFANANQSAVSGKTLNAVTAASSERETYVVGNDGFAYRRGNFLGGEYNRTQTTNTTKHLYGAWISASNVFAVGETGVIVRRPARGLDDSWTVVNPGTAPGQKTLRGVFGFSDSQIFAAGDNLALLYFDGAVWTPVPLPNIKTGLTRRLYAVWGTGPSNVYAVGEGGTILHYLP